MKERVFIWVQHLLGFGHFARARVIAEALRDGGVGVTLASGGITPASAVPAGIDFVQLPGARARNDLFDELVDEHGQLTTPQWHEARRDLLVSAFHHANPDLLITETFPFGRRLLEAELLALLEAAKHRKQPPKVVCSVRDVLQRPRKADRAIAMVERAYRHYDAILVHGDSNLIRLEESFPEVARISERCTYTGYICKEVPRSQLPREEILVSAGGGAAGANLIAAVIEARTLSSLKSRPWTIVTGPLAEGKAAYSDEGLSIVRELPDFPSRLAGAALSISQAGYNTVVETIAACTPAIVVPFETDREQEQITRARVLERQRLVRLLRASELKPSALARLVDETANSSVPEHNIDLDGREGTVRAVKELLSR